MLLIFLTNSSLFRFAHDQAKPFTRIHKIPVIPSNISFLWPRQKILTSLMGTAGIFEPL